MTIFLALLHYDHFFSARIDLSFFIFSFFRVVLQLLTASLLSLLSVHTHTHTHTQTPPCCTWLHMFQLGRRESPADTPNDSSVYLITITCCVFFVLFYFSLLFFFVFILKAEPSLKRSSEMSTTIWRLDLGFGHACYERANISGPCSLCVLQEIPPI